MDLMCTSSSTISLMYVQFFIGMLVSRFLTFIPDRIGRKKCVIGGMTLSLAAQITMLLVPNMLIRSIGFFFLGLSTIKNSQTYAWGSECVPLKRRT